MEKWELKTQFSKNIHVAQLKCMPLKVDHGTVQFNSHCNAMQFMSILPENDYDN